MSKDGYNISVAPESLPRPAFSGVPNSRVVELERRVADLKKTLTQVLSQSADVGVELAIAHQLLRTSFFALLKAGHSKPLRELIKAALPAEYLQKPPESNVMATRVEKWMDQKGRVFDSEKEAQRSDEIDSLAHLMSEVETDFGHADFTKIATVLLDNYELIRK